MPKYGVEKKPNTKKMYDYWGAIVADHNTRTSHAKKLKEKKGNK